MISAQNLVFGVMGSTDAIQHSFFDDVVFLMIHEILLWQNFDILTFFVR